MDALQTRGATTTANKMSEKAIDVVVNEKWVVRVNIVEEEVGRAPPSDDDDGSSRGAPTEEPTPSRPTIQALMEPDVTVQDAKALVFRLRGIRSEDQRLSDLRGEPQLIGALPAVGTSVNLLLHVVPLDPRLESLYTIAYMGSMKYRDDMMKTSITPRAPRDCPCDEGSLTPVRMDARLQCSKCLALQSQVIRLHRCSLCGYSLCCSCFETDTGRTVATCPYTALVSIAERLGRNVATVATTYGIGDTQRRYQVSWYGTWGEACPPIFKKSIGIGSTLLHKGIRLVIRFDESVRSVLDDNGVLIEKDPAEVDIILEASMTLEQVVRLRDSWESWPSWQIVKSAVEKAASSEEDDNTRHHEAYSEMRLVSYTFDKVVYERSARLETPHY